MIEFYEAKVDGYYLIMISEEEPKIGKTYIGWKPTYLSERLEFSSLMDYTRKVIPWWYFHGSYRFGPCDRMGTITITSITKMPKTNPYTGTSYGPLTDWLNKNIRISEKDLKEVQALNHPEHWDATYMQYHD